MPVSRVDYLSLSLSGVLGVCACERVFSREKMEARDLALLALSWPASLSLLYEATNGTQQQQQQQQAAAALPMPTQSYAASDQLRLLQELLLYRGLLASSIARASLGALTASADGRPPPTVGSGEVENESEGVRVGENCE